jgi:hypothetical protein
MLDAECRPIAFIAVLNRKEHKGHPSQRTQSHRNRKWAMRGLKGVRRCGGFSQPKPGLRAGETPAPTTLQSGFRVEEAPDHGADIVKKLEDGSCSMDVDRVR